MRSLTCSLLDKDGYTDKRMGQLRRKMRSMRAKIGDGAHAALTTLCYSRKCYCYQNLMLYLRSCPFHCAVVFIREAALTMTA